MKVEEFVNSYSAEYIQIFHKVEQQEKLALSTRISKFLFEPRYEVNSLRFKIVD